MDNNTSEHITQFASVMTSNMSEPGEQKIGNGASDVMDQLRKLYPCDQNLDTLASALLPGDLEKVSTVLIQLVEEEITNILIEVRP